MALSPVAILAGSGELPLLVADSLMARGFKVRILAFKGFASKAVCERAECLMSVLDVKGILSWLQNVAPHNVALLGAISRPDPFIALQALSLLKNRCEIMNLLSRGDDHLLRGVVGMLEDQGHTVSGILELAPEVLARAGVLCEGEAFDAFEIELGFKVLKQLSPFDIGQAAAVCGNRVLAIEGPEGTDKMLKRVRALSSRWFFSTKAKKGILVKTAKENQDLRVDLPVIGPRTVLNAAKAGLAGIVLGAQRSIIIQPNATLAAARKLGIGILCADPLDIQVPAQKDGSS